MPAIGLFLAAPLIAEYLFGNLPMAMLRTLLVLAPRRSGAPGLAGRVSSCTVVGMLEAWQCEIAETELAAGDTLILYSDGVVEAERPEGDSFGEDRLIAVLREHRHGSAQDLVRAIVDATLEFSEEEQQDDITLVVARALPGSA
jgi:serine/threonine protein phosphatase PrpC